MRALLLGALWINLASSLLLLGAVFMLWLAGPGDSSGARRWEASVTTWCRGLVLVALVSGLAWLMARTAVFENRPHAALEPRALWRATLDTWPGLVWLARQGLLAVLGVFLTLRADLRERRNWIASRAEALALAALALVLGSAASHAAAISPGTERAVASDVAHLLAAGLWLGALPPLALLLHVASRDDSHQARDYAARAARRFSRVALVAMLALVAAGVLNSIVHVETVAGLVGTTHGRLLLAKLALLVPILALALVNRRRLLPALAAPSAPGAMRRLAASVSVEALLAVVLVLPAAAMTLTTPARHAEPVWPFPVRLALDAPSDDGTTKWQVRIERAYPTSYRRPLVTYHADSIAAGMAVYTAWCAGCHGADGASARTDLRREPTTRRSAGEIFWLIGRGGPGRDMPSFEGRLGEGQRWDIVNFVRALGAADRARTMGRTIEPDRAWLVAPDFTVAVGPLAPTALRDHRGRRMVLIVLYTLPGSRARMTELARSYDVLSVLGVEIVAVPVDASPEAIRELGADPPVTFPVVTDGAAEIAATYGLFAPGPHAEILVDRQGYVRGIWRAGDGGPPPPGAVQAQVEKLNAEKSPPPFPDDHVH